MLRALAGQTLSVDPTFTEGRAILVVWGEDGNILLSDHAEVSNFAGVLPTTQDYYILVKGRPDGHTFYSMTVTIPPAPQKKKGNPNGLLLTRTMNCKDNSFFN
jgi:hypothetical protein